MAIPVPAGPEAGMYSMAPSGDGALLSWLEPIGGVLELRFSSLDGDRWPPPMTIVRGTHLFSNWADHPSIAAQADGTLLAQWPVINDGPQPPGSYNNSMRIAMSKDDGRTWSEVFADGLDNTHSYTGFVSLLPTPDGPRAVYLSPPRPISHDPFDHRMTLSFAAFDAAGARLSPGVVDPDTCSCCPTAFGLTAAGPIAAYRDHEPGEIRDIAVVRWTDGAWTAPRPVHRDGWKINGCPTNGPAIAAEGRNVAVAWFTAANDSPRLRLAFSGDSARPSRHRSNSTAGRRSAGPPLRCCPTDPPWSPGWPRPAAAPDLARSASGGWLAMEGSDRSVPLVRPHRAASPACPSSYAPGSRSSWPGAAMG